MKKEVYKKMLLSLIAKNLNWKILTRIQLLLKDGMGALKMDNFNIMQVHWNGGHKKTIYRGELPKKGGRLGQFADLSEGAWQKRGQCTFCRLLALTRLGFPTLYSLNQYD